jgi:hypothetical protein
VGWHFGDLADEGTWRYAGFEGAPLLLGIDEDGRERLAFIDGEVPVAPYP